jgi:hypothetical protein
VPESFRKLAVEAVTGEPVSAGIFPLKRESTGNFRRFSRRNGIRLCFPHDKSGGCGEIPYAKEQGIVSREQRISPAYQGMPHEHGGQDQVRTAHRDRSGRHHSQKGRSPDGGTGPLRVPMGVPMQWAVIHWPGAVCSHRLLGCAGLEKLNRFDAPFARRDRQSAGKSFRLSLLLR